MRQQRGRALRDQAGDRRQRDRHLVQHRDIARRQRTELRLRTHDAQPSLGMAGVQRQEALLAQQRFLCHEGQPGGLGHLFVQRGVGLEPQRVEERGAQGGIGLLQQGRGKDVALPELVGVARQILLPAQGAEQEAALRIAVLRLQRRLAHARRQALAHELLVQREARGVEVVDASTLLPVDHEQQMRQLQRGAGVVDPRELQELRTAVQARQGIRSRRRLHGGIAARALLVGRRLARGLRQRGCHLPQQREKDTPRRHAWPPRGRTGSIHDAGSEGRRARIIRQRLRVGCAARRCRAWFGV
ncbi:hypothetical protein NB689_003147 [Xanthomonas sacchari]|nr:hypothetical protein [Xanthomonas sacchari]